MRGCQQFVPPEEWQFGPMPLARRAVLESVVFDVIVTRVVSEATLVSAQVEIAHDRAAPENTLRVAFRFAVTADTGDLLHNGRDGLRAQHWVSPQLGERATRDLVDQLGDRFSRSIARGLSLRGAAMNAPKIFHAMALPSTKVWVCEDQLKAGGQFLDVPRWAANENEPNNPRMWRWTPLATEYELKTAWMTPDQAAWIPECKSDRADQIHRWGFT
ncbi:hypothetical protein ABH977_006239 [Bradyrhizobium ottawaense]|nr:hypothetical protein BwSH14_12090 [Bradyrhizobium ottawaense]GMO30606.1 hypothetical protein BwSF21_32320 [Bradyrhizobium ottawaense]GMO41049.1 hypothetical protein BwSF12_43910 [Bradyrhizobium ottawaense]GMO54145.1 hypothetical protein BwSG20_00480 [Bradyrhizobium ottawaense]GMO76444.1 hypothetical protein BwSH17_42990 [Bradyrhizobium ottawaense]